MPASKRSMRDPRATRVAPGRAAGVDGADVGGPGNGVHATPAGVPCAGPESITRNAAPAGEPIPMRKQPTGEPCAGELHARFGGREAQAFPTPIQNPAIRVGAGFLPRTPPKRSHHHAHELDPTETRLRSDEICHFAPLRVRILPEPLAENRDPFHTRNVTHRESARYSRRRTVSSMAGNSLHL